MPMGQMQKTIKMNVSTSKDLWPTQVVDEVQKVMEQGERDGKEGWKDVPASEHLYRAYNHLAEARETTELGIAKTEDHLAHAFTRLMMAVAIECGYTDKPFSEGDGDA